MSVHCGLEYANWHTAKQVPNDTLRKKLPNGKTCHMAQSFRNALIWHMNRDDTKIAQIVRATGVSRDVINKLLARDNSSTDAENALLIASYYGKTVNQFVNLEDVAVEQMGETLFELLRPEEKRIVSSQIRGMIAARASKEAD